MRVWFATGASRGFGAEVVRAALRAGDAVVATARRPETIVENVGPQAREAGDRLLVIDCDVTDPASVDEAVEAALSRFGHVDVLFNNAGRGLIGAVEEVSDREARDVFDVNVFGVLNVTRALLPSMRDRASGHVVMMSSMGGVAQPGGGWGMYGATKFALEGLSEALANEVGPLGIGVTLVEPGGFRTDFLDGSSIAIAARRIADYDVTAGRVRDGASDRNHLQPGDPGRAATAIVAVAGTPDAPLRMPLGADAIDVIEAKLASVARDVERGRAEAIATRADDRS